jgi:hypothetical protein
LLSPYSEVGGEVLHNLEIDRKEFVGAVCQDSTSGSNDRAVSAPGKESFSFFIFIYRQSSWVPSPHLENSERETEAL